MPRKRDKVYTFLRCNIKMRSTEKAKPGQKIRKSHVPNVGVTCSSAQEVMRHKYILTFADNARLNIIKGSN